MTANFLSALADMAQAYSYKKRLEKDEEDKKREAQLRAGLMTDIASGRTYAPPLDPYGEGQMPGREYGLGTASMVGPGGGPATQQDITAPGQQMPYTEFSQIAALPEYQEMMAENPEALPSIIQMALSSTGQAGREHEADVARRRAELEQGGQERAAWDIIGQNPEMAWMQQLQGTGYAPSDLDMRQALQPPRPFQEEYGIEQEAQRALPLFGQGGMYADMSGADFTPEEQEIASRSRVIAEEGLEPLEQQKEIVGKRKDWLDLLLEQIRQNPYLATDMEGLAASLDYQAPNDLLETAQRIYAEKNRPRTVGRATPKKQLTTADLDAIIASGVIDVTAELNNAATADPQAAELITNARNAGLTDEEIYKELVKPDGTE